MEWQQLIGFYHVARLKSFTKAAEVTLRTQSALSQQVKALEEELGCQLFERVGKRRIAITTAGERLLRFVESMLQGHENLVVELNHLKRIPKGVLKIAAPFTTLYHLFPEKIKVYVERYPHVELTLLDRPQGRVVQLVKEGEVDFGFALESVVPKDVQTVRWKKVETVLMVPKGHPLTRLEPVNFEDIAFYPLILPPKNIKHQCRRFFEKQMSKLGLEYRIIMESSNVELSSAYVEMGLGISFATIQRDLPVLRQKKLEFIPMDHYFKPDYLTVITRKGREFVPYQQALLSMLLDGHEPIRPPAED